MIFKFIKRKIHEKDNLKIGQIVVTAMLSGYGSELSELIKENRIDSKMPILQKIGYSEKDVSFMKKHKKAIIKRYNMLVNCKGDMNKLLEYIEAGD